MAGTQDRLAAQTDASTTAQTKMVALVNALAAAKSRQSVDEAMQIYHPDCVLEAPSLGSRYKGTEAVRAALVGFFTRYPDYEVTLDGHAASGNILAAWGSIRMTLSGRPGGQIPNGERASLPVFILFGFAEERIVWESFNFDVATLCRQSGVSVDALVPEKEMAQ